jgi:hypothetical protein
MPIKITDMSYSHKDKHRTIVLGLLFLSISIGFCQCKKELLNNKKQLTDSSLKSESNDRTKIADTQQGDILK